MKNNIYLTHKFVEYIPDKLEDRTVYVSIRFATAVHKCCCGCGHEVVTPLSPSGWQLSYDGESISLSPSIGNWGFPCKSHYWIKNDSVKWARKWSTKEIYEDHSTNDKSGCEKNTADKTTVRSKSKRK